MQALVLYDSLDSYTIFSCRNVTNVEESAGEKKPVTAIIYLVYGIVVQILYVLSLSVIWNSEYRKMSCYKLMFTLGVLDIFTIFIGCELTAFLIYTGAVYCMYPTIIYYGGIGVNGKVNEMVMATGVLHGSSIIQILDSHFGYNSGSTLCLVLVLNRFIYFWKPHVAEVLFRGKRTWFFVGAALLYTSTFLWKRPTVFNANYGTWVYDPEIPGVHFDYTSYMQTWHNLTICTASSILYILFLVLHTYKAHRLRISVERFQKKLFIQASLVCCFTLTTAFIWASFSFVQPTQLMMHVGHASWMLMHGTPAFVYVFLNRTIQMRILRMFRITNHYQSSVHNVTQTKHENASGTKNDNITSK